MEGVPTPGDHDVMLIFLLTSHHTIRNYLKYTNDPWKI